MSENSKKRPPSDASLLRENTEVDIDDIDGLVFEDPFGDEYEDEEIEENETDIKEDGGELNEENTQKQVWRPNIDKLEEGEDLEYDPSAYVMYHSMRTEWPCLSFDILKDNLGDNRQRVSFNHNHFLSIK